MKVVAIVGMTGAGKTEAARVFAASGFTVIRFGDVTDVELKKRNLELNEENERHIRELLRRECGMAAYAELNLPRIDKARADGDVAIDGLYSWEEYVLLKDHYRGDFHVVAVCASPRTRHKRLADRLERPLTLDEAAGRDRAEIENLNKGGPIAAADYIIVNESSLEALEKAVKGIIEALK